MRSIVLCSLFSILELFPTFFLTFLFFKIFKSIGHTMLTKVYYVYQLFFKYGTVQFPTISLHISLESSSEWLIWWKATAMLSFHTLTSSSVRIGLKNYYSIRIRKYSFYSFVSYFWFTKRCVRTQLRQTDNIEVVLKSEKYTTVRKYVYMYVYSYIYVCTYEWRRMEIGYCMLRFVLKIKKTFRQNITAP